MSAANLEKNNVPFVDFSTQFALSSSVDEVEDAIISGILEIAKKASQGKIDKVGSLVVLGNFEKFGPKIEGMTEMKPGKNPIKNLHMVNTSDVKLIFAYSVPPADGAIIIDRSGQIIGAGIYLVIDNPLIDVPHDCGTRHKAAASFSLRDDVIAVYTLSEETNLTRIWKNGIIEKVIDIKENRATRANEGRR